MIKKASKLSLGVLLALFSLSAFSVIAPPVTCESNCSAEVGTWIAAHPGSCSGDYNCYYGHAYSVGAPPDIVVHCVIYRYNSVSNNLQDNYANVPYDCTTEDGCPTGSTFDPVLGQCVQNEREDCGPDDPDFHGYESDGRTPICYDSLPDNCGYVDGQVVCWDEGDLDPEEEPPPNTPPDKPGPTECIGCENPAENPPNAPIDVDDPLATPAPEEGDERLTSGGGDCQYPPRCSGDQIDCNAIFQAWKTRCAIEANQPIFDSLGAILTATDTTMPSLPDVDSLQSDNETLITDMLETQVDSFQEFSDSLPESMDSSNEITAAITEPGGEIADILGTSLPSDSGCSNQSFSMPGGYTFTIRCDFSSVAKEILYWLFAIMTLVYILHTITDLSVAGNS